MAKNDNKVTLAPVSDYPEQSTQIRSVEETLAVEGRVQGDQIPDYHTVNKTLDASGPEHDPEVQAELRAQALAALAPSKKEIKEQVKNAKENSV